MHGRHGAGARRDAGGDMERRAVSATMQHAPGVPAGWSIECCWAERRREQGTTGRLHLRGVRASSCRQVVSRAAHFCATPGRHVGDGHGARLVGPPRRVRLRSTSARACGLSVSSRLWSQVHCRGCRIGAGRDRVSCWCARAAFRRTAIFTSTTLLDCARDPRWQACE
jgi:hypothetical protein